MEANIPESRCYQREAAQLVRRLLGPPLPYLDEARLDVQHLPVDAEQTERVSGRTQAAPPSADVLAADGSRR